MGKVFVVKLMVSSKVFTLLVCFIIYTYFTHVKYYIILNYLKEEREKSEEEERKGGRQEKRNPLAPCCLEAKFQLLSRD